MTSTFHTFLSHYFITNVFEAHNFNKIVINNKLVRKKKVQKGAWNEAHILLPEKLTETKRKNPSRRKIFMSAVYMWEHINKPSKQRKSYKRIKSFS